MKLVTAITGSLGVFLAFSAGAQVGETCTIRSIDCNSSVQGRLEPTDCGFFGVFFDVYNFDGRAGSDITVAVSADGIDTSLSVVGPDFNVSDDNSGPGDNPLVTGQLSRSGPYTITVNTFLGGLGNYGLTLACTETAVRAPSDLTVDALSSSSLELRWRDRSDNEEQFEIQRRRFGEEFTTLVTLPANRTSFTVEGLPEARTQIFRVRARNASRRSAFSNVASAATLSEETVCIPTDARACLGDRRFIVEGEWQDFSAVEGTARLVQDGNSDDSALFYFFAPDNWEALVKLIDACVEPFDRFWFFAAATTNVEYTLRVIDTESGRVREYYNPLGRSAPAITDTTAFATCPGS